MDDSGSSSSSDEGASHRNGVEAGFEAPSPPREVHVLIPDLVEDSSLVRNEFEQFSSNWGKQDYIHEMKRLMDTLGYLTTVHPVTTRNYREVIATIPNDDHTLIFNLCDGLDRDGFPGPQVARFLEQETDRRVIGCAYYFMHITSSKDAMKRIFQEKNVPTSPFVTVTTDPELLRATNNTTATPAGDDIDYSSMSAYHSPAPLTLEEIDTPKLDALFRSMKFPLFVKASDSYGSAGLSDHSVVHSANDARAQIRAMLKDFPTVVIEEFILGAEYTVLVVGESYQEERNGPEVVFTERTDFDVYPPARRVFREDLKPLQQFLSYDRNWVDYKSAYRYQPVSDSVLAEQLRDVARRAYSSVRGDCFGRVDMRRRDSTGEIFVLEVNASCGIGAESSSEHVLKMIGQTTKDLLDKLFDKPRRGQAGSSKMPPTTGGIPVL